MNLNSFAFICDENIDPAVIEFLKSQGHNAISVHEVGLNNSSDIEILQHSFKNNLVVLTHDSDFGKIVYSQKVDFVGIVYLRPGHFQPAFTITSLKTVFGYELDFIPPFIAVIEQKDNIVKVRLRNSL